MKHLILSILFAYAMSASVATARESPAVSFVKQDCAVLPLAVPGWPMLAICIYTTPDCSPIQTPATCDNVTTALCRSTAFVGPSVFVSGRYCCTYFSAGNPLDKPERLSGSLVQASIGRLKVPPS